MKVKLTPTRIKRLKPSLREYVQWDTETPHLGVRVKPSGELRYIHFIQKGGRAKKTTIGDARTMPLDEARTIALDLSAGAGGDNVRQIRPTLTEWIEKTWWPQVAIHHKPSTRKRHRHSLDKQLLPAFGGIRLDKIDRAKVLGWFESRSRTAPGSANRELELLAMILNHAAGAGLIPHNPAKGISRNPGKKMTRFLSSDERLRLLAELDAAPPRFRFRALAVKMLLFTGCRRNEILFLRWSEMGEGSLNLADSKTGARQVWLGDEAMAVLKEARTLQDERGAKSEYVFPYYRDPRRCDDKIDTFWRTIRSKAKLGKLRIHDLRHSFASEAVRQGVALPTVSKLLGHSTIRMTMRYTHSSDAEVEAASERIGSSLATMLSGENERN